MSSLFGQVWLYSLLAFLVGAGVTWLLFVRPAHRRLAELEDKLVRVELARAKNAASSLRPPVYNAPPPPLPQRPEPVEQQLVDPVFADPVPTQVVEPAPPVQPEEVRAEAADADAEPVQPEPAHDETARIDMPTAKVDRREPTPTLSDIPPAPTEYLEQLQRQREAEQAEAAANAEQEQEPLFFEATTPPMGISQAAIQQELRAAGAADEHAERPRPSAAPRSTQPTAPPEVDPMEMELADHTPTALIPRVEWRGGYPDSAKPAGDAADDVDVDDPNAGAAQSPAADCEPERAEVDEFAQREQAALPAAHQQAPEPEPPQRQVALSRGSAAGRIVEPEAAPQPTDAQPTAVQPEVAPEPATPAQPTVAQQEAQPHEDPRSQEPSTEAQPQPTQALPAEPDRAEALRAEANRREAELRKLQEQQPAQPDRTRSLFEPVVDPDSAPASPNGNHPGN
ncbi:hypothetical protein [Allokutzneria albata]|uniref:Uncharacterized protein n=1 Tax=Allokutzneria albata TaxID=211114 RepID=A0A1G9Z3D5_ALLAB|nr:hypothetical protein [Allokutzneria albata]SDN15291.1 hypothetical protein SAMN04489726_5207 [Allokutzneria albata]